MSFIQKLISWKKVLIIDIWTYKIKIALCEFKNNTVQILDLVSKKQESKNILSWEIADIYWVSETILFLFKKLLQKNNLPKDIVINIPTSSIISIWKNINYKREKKDEKIDFRELDNIIWKIEFQALEEAKKEIKQKTWYLDIDMKLITSSITNILIDNFKVSNPIWFTWKEINISTLNMFIPYSRYNIFESISWKIWKNILSIIPQEFCIPKMFEYTDYKEDDIIFIDIWSSKTSIIVQKKWVIIWNTRIEIWIQDLIQNIKSNTFDTTINIINLLHKKDENIEEKTNFLQVWTTWLIIWLKEILNSSLIPNKIFISWWWDNLFIREYLKNIDLNEFWLHSTKPINFIEINFENEIEILSENKEIFDKTNIALLSMILQTKEIININKNPINDILKKFLEENEF